MRKQYPKEAKSWEDQLPTLLTFYNYPALTRPAIYTTNPIERKNRELRNRLKPMNSLTNIEAAEKSSICRRRTTTKNGPAEPYEASSIQTLKQRLIPCTASGMRGA
ncbi:transposase [Paenibacillus sp. 1P07SE]|uniref:transposase n=1 Tax=Paenibacillus sp. 1P07SE TaxID=3132209 RepID=UPI0039A424B1